jgi:hypothetical protein
VKHVNIAEPNFTYDPENPEGFRVGTFRSGPLVAAEELGTGVYELRPGQSVCPAATIYPDSDKIAIWTGNREDDLIVHRPSGVDYCSGEPRRLS